MMQNMGGRSDEEVLEFVAVYGASGSTAAEIEAEVAKLEVLRAERAAFDTAVLAGLGEDGATIARIRPFGDYLFGAVAHHGIVREACCDMLAALRKRDARRTAAPRARRAHPKSLGRRRGGSEEVKKKVFIAAAGPRR